jgi:hypothetical protein
VSRQERFKRCTECKRKNISPFIKGTVCGQCIAEAEIERIRNGGSTEEAILCSD